MDKRKDIRAAEKTRGVQRGWKWWQKTDRRRRTLEEYNNDRTVGGIYSRTMETEVICGDVVKFRATRDGKGRRKEANMMG